MVIRVHISSSQLKQRGLFLPPFPRLHCFSPFVSSGTVLLACTALYRRHLHCPPRQPPPQFRPHCSGSPTSTSSSSSEPTTIAFRLHGGKARYQILRPRYKRLPIPGSQAPPPLKAVTPPMNPTQYSHHRPSPHFHHQQSQCHRRASYRPPSLIRRMHPRRRVPIHQPIQD